MLRVSESWFYKQAKDPATRRAARRMSLGEEIKRIFDQSGGTYGSPRIFIKLVRAVREDRPGNSRQHSMPASTTS